MIRQLLLRFRRKPVVTLPPISDKTAKQIEAVILDKPIITSRGRVVSDTKKAEFQPFRTRTGGRIVKAMPRQLQKVKQGQEKAGD